MSRKWLVRAIAILMAALMAFSLLYAAVESFSVSAKVTQSQIDKLKQQKQQIEKKKKEIQSKINSLEYQQSTALAKKKVLDDQIEYTQDEIENINEQIETYEQLIQVKSEEAQAAQQREDEQLKLFKSRLRTMEENGTISYLAVIFNASSFADLLARIDVVSEIMEYDKRLYEELKAAKQATLEAKKELEAAKAGQEAEKEELKERQKELEAQLAEASELLETIQKNIEEAKELYRQEVEESNRIQSEINKKIEELRRQEEAGKSTVVGTGTLIWPTPSCYIVTSQYGMRYHPIYHQYRMHTGIDIGAKYGASVLASDSGTVIISEYSSSYGNYIVISHGNGVTTLYAHLSSRNVKEGAKVKQGDVIGKVGSTGASTGPHLHYEVSVNGSRVNPLKYFTGYTIDEG